MSVLCTLSTSCEVSNKFEERAQPFAWQDFRRPSAIPIPIDGLAVYRSGCEMMSPNEIIRPPKSRMEFLAMTPDAIRWNEVWRSVFMTLSMNLVPSRIKPFRRGRVSGTHKSRHPPMRSRNSYQQLREGRMPKPSHHSATFSWVSRYHWLGFRCLRRRSTNTIANMRSGGWEALPRPPYVR